MTDGSLFLVDFGRSECAPLGSVPAHNALLTNLAWETAATVIGSGNETTLSATFENTIVGQPTMGTIERTSKYGIHVIASQTANDTSNRHGGISIPDPILNRILTGLPGRTFYCSIWGRLTRVATAGVDAICYVGDVSNATRHAWAFNQQPAISPNTGSAFVGSQATPGSNVTGNFFRAVAVDEFTGTEPILANTVGKLWFGQYGVYSSFQRNGAASGIIYRMYIEDLTSSGRSYADTVAADRAMYDAAVGTGGRFNGDTFTAPSTIP